MKITTWNARGLNTPSKKFLLKRNLTLFDSDITLLQETKLNKEEGIKLSQKVEKWKFEFQHSQGASRGLGLIWNPRQRVVNIKLNLQIVIINAYGPSPTIDKLVVWSEINTFINSMPQEIVIIGGDFNVVLSKEEKQRGSNQVCKAMEDFKNWI